MELLLCSFVSDQDSASRYRDRLSRGSAAASAPHGTCCRGVVSLELLAVNYMCVTLLDKMCVLLFLRDLRGIFFRVLEQEKQSIVGSLV